MPIYEFYCPDNNTLYSFLAKTMRYGDRVPRCPEDPSFQMEKKVSNFAFVGTAKEAPEEGGLDSVDDAKMESVMAELERDMAGFDESNPDPRQMAQLMRKMTNLTGEKLPGEMEEMVRRLESGEDPEKLEEEYGDVIDSMDDGDAVDAASSDAAKKLRRLHRRMTAPKKDSTLYDMAEYCD